MGKKNSEPSKYREWERERRERLNVSFNDLGSLLPNHDPAISTSKVDILQKSAAYIRDLKKENSDLLLGGSNKIQTKKIKRLQRYVEALLLRVQQLAKLLKDAGISLPPEPPSITPLGEKPLLWSNKLSPKDAEKALESIEKPPKNASQKKSKASKKTEEKDVEKNDEVGVESSAKSSNSPNSVKNLSTAEPPSSENKLWSSQQKTNTDSTTVVLPNKEKTLQESRPPLPVGQLFGDTSHVLTSLPPRVVSTDQQPGIIVIRTTGASTLGAVAQQAPQSTCFVIDSGSGATVGNGQASTIVASHPPTLEQRPTFVLASNGSLLPVLSAPQFVAQPRQLIVSTSSPPVPPAKQSLAPISFTPSGNNSQCRKPIKQKFREVACSQPLTGDMCQLKKLPIPALPRNKQKLVSNSKDGSDGSAKLSAKKKCVSPDGESAKTCKSVTSKSVEKKNSKSAPEITPQVKLSPSKKPHPQDVSISAAASEKPVNDRKETTFSATSTTPSKDNVADSRKRELDMKNARENVQLKRKKCENSSNEDKSEPKTSLEKQTASGQIDSVAHNSPICNMTLSSNAPYNSLASSCSVSSYSIDALCKMNEKITADSGCESLKNAVSANKEKGPPNETNSNVRDKVQQNENICESDDIVLNNSSASENVQKSLSTYTPAEISDESAKSASDCVVKSIEQLNEGNGREALTQINSSVSPSSQPEECGSVRNGNAISHCTTENRSPARIESSISASTKDSAVVDCEIKEKTVSQSSILPSFGSSSNFATSDDVYRKEEEGRENNCETSGVDESSLPPGTFSSDLFASLQVPSGHSESISPTAAFLLAFPLVSTLTGKTPDLGSDNHPTQPLASMDSGNGDSEHSSGGCGTSFLQLGNLEDNSPSSSSQSILSSLSSSNAPSLQSSIIHLKSTSTLHSLLPSSIEPNYGREAVETNIHLVERQLSAPKDILSKEVVAKDASFISSSSSSVSLKDTQILQENSVAKEAPVPISKIESSSSKTQKEIESESRNQTNGKVSSREVTDVNNISGRYSAHVEKPASCDNASVPNPSPSERLPVSSTATKPNLHACHNHQLEGITASENPKKDATEDSILPPSNQQYIHYQMPYLSCSSTGLSEPIAASNGLIISDGSGNNGPGNMRQEMQALDHALSNTSNNHTDIPSLPQTSTSLPFSSVTHRYKTADKSHSSDHKQQIQNNAYPSNSYSQYNPTSTLSSPVCTSSGFTISSFTSSFPSSVSNSLLPSCPVTASSASFSSANSSLLLPTSSSYPDSSASFPTNSNGTYLSSSSSYIPPIYSNTFNQPLSSSTASFSNASFTPVSEPVISSAPSSKTTDTISKASVSSHITASSSHQNSFGSLHGNTMSSLPPTSFVNSVKSVNYDNGQKLNSHPIPTSHQHCGQVPKNSGASLQQKMHEQGSSSSSINIPVSEPIKTHHIFSIDQLNTQNYGYNYNDYSSHVSGYMPQKPEMETTRKPPNLSSETLGGNITSRMPGSFSVAHNSSNFSILSWTTLSPMSAAPSSTIDPQINNVNSKGDAYSSNHGPLGPPSIDNGSSPAEKASDSHTSSFPQSLLPEGREITSSYPQFPVGNSNNVGTELSGSTGYPLSQDIGKQPILRGHGPKQRQQVTNWMTAPDPIHSSSDFSHSNDNANSDNVRDAFGNSASYSSNSGFYGHHNHLDVAYASSSNTSVSGNACLESRNSIQSSTVGTNRNSQKGCSSTSGGNSSVADNIHQLQSKPTDGHQNQSLPCTYDKMTNSSANYVHHSQSDLPALPTLVGDLALGSCSSIKGFLPVYDEANSVTSKVCKQDLGKVQLPNTNSITCSNMLSGKDNRDSRHTSVNHEYGVSSFLSVSQLVEHVKDSSQQSQQKESERGEKTRNRDSNKSAPSSRRNMRPSNIKRDGVGMGKDQLEHTQISHSCIPPHDAQSFHNQGISSSVVSSNPTHLHAPPIPFPPYKSVHWPVTDNSRNTTNYKSSSSYSAESLIRPSLSAIPMDSRIADVEMPSYGMDIHKFPIPSGRSDHIFPDFVESNNVSCNVDPQQQNQLKQQTQDHRQGNENFRSSHHSHCERFNYSSSVAPPSTFHSHHHHPHLPPPSFGNHEDYTVEAGNPTSTLGLPANCMDFPFSHPKDSAPLASSTSNVCLPLGYNPPNPCLGVSQNQSQQCRLPVEKASVRSGNCEEPSSGSTLEQLGPSKSDGNAESRTKQSTKDATPVMNNNTRSIPPFLPMESNSSSYIGHHHYHPHNHHNSPPHHPGASPMGPAHFAPLNDPEHQGPKLFPRFPPPSSGMTSSLPHQSSAANSSIGCGSTSGGNLSSGTLTNFNLSTIFPEINDKQSHQNQMAPSTSSFGTTSKNDKLCTVSSSAPLLHPPPPPLSTSYHHHQPHQHNHQPFPPPVDLGNRLPPPHPSSSVLHSNVSFNNLMVQSTPQVNGIAINSPLQPPPPPPFSAPSFANVMPGL